jgi:hypothetical protein
VGNYTKGPWRVIRSAAFSYQITTDYPQGHAHYGVIVQEVRSEENAQLVAAAPELLEALRACLPYLPTHNNALDYASTNEGRVGSIHLAAEQARNAIRKAVSRG